MIAVAPLALNSPVGVSPSPSTSPTPHDGLTSPTATPHFASPTSIPSASGSKRSANTLSSNPSSGSKKRKLDSAVIDQSMLQCASYAHEKTSRAPRSRPGYCSIPGSPSAAFRRACRAIIQPLWQAFNEPSKHCARRECRKADFTSRPRRRCGPPVLVDWSPPFATVWPHSNKGLFRADTAPPRSRLNGRYPTGTRHSPYARSPPI